VKSVISRLALTFWPALLLAGCADPIRDLETQAAARCESAGGTYTVNFEQYRAKQANGIVVGSCSSEDPVAIAVR
jgi:hypothetical protein